MGRIVPPQNPWVMPQSPSGEVLEVEPRGSWVRGAQKGWFPRALLMPSRKNKQKPSLCVTCVCPSSASVIYLYMPVLCPAVPAILPLPVRVCSPPVSTRPCCPPVSTRACCPPSVYPCLLSTSVHPCLPSCHLSTHVSCPPSVHPCLLSTSVHPCLLSSVCPPMSAALPLACCLPFWTSVSLLATQSQSWETRAGSWLSASQEDQPCAC